MKQEIRSTFKKTVKIAAGTCIALGSMALVTSAVAVKAMAEGTRYLKNTVRKIAGESDAVVEADSTAETVAEEADVTGA